MYFWVKNIYQLNLYLDGSRKIVWLQMFASHVLEELVLNILEEFYILRIWNLKLLQDPLDSYWFNPYIFSIIFN